MHIRKNYVIYLIPVLVCILFCGCKKNEAVNIQDKGSHYLLSIDYTSGKTHYEIGKLAGLALLKGVD
ncbi:MAG TPA: hypothetical protein PKG60_15535, partial [Spirochaetota bacterium]|nr:hypothetical protein [Spirochaetota bacterium]